MIYLELFARFFMTGLFTIGGGLATLPFLYEMSAATGWFTTNDIANMVAISESTPGALGLNMATYAGYHTAGIPGGIIATLGLVAPSFIIIIIISKLLDRFRNNRYVNRAFYGLRPASIALIAAAGLNVARSTLIDEGFITDNGFSAVFANVQSFFTFLNWKAILLGVAIFLAARKLKWHPIVYIVIAAVVGIIFEF